VLDSIVIAPVDVKFELTVRNAGNSLVLATWSKHFEPLADGYDAQPYEVDKDAPAIHAAPGDELVFRYTATNTKSNEAWIPNGDGKLAGGRIPSIMLPP